MLAQWLGTQRCKEFLELFYLKQPFALPGVGKNDVVLGSWPVLISVLASNPDVLIVKNGRLIDGPTPRTKIEALRYLSRGCSLVARKVEKHDHGVAALASSMAKTLEAPVVVQFYATPKDHHSFGWHYDAEEVFIIQTHGVKEYFLRPNTVHPLPLLDAMPKDMQFERETSPHIACTLVPGDILYIPGGMWHVARAIEPSLSLSIGASPKAVVDLFPEDRHKLMHDVRWRQRLPLSEEKRRALLAELLPGKSLKKTSELTY